MSKTIGNIKGSDIVEEDDKSVTFTAGAQLDGDGANGQFGEPPCYAPASYQGKTLDLLANAGSPGNWYGVVTDTGKNNGTPIVQGPEIRVRGLSFRRPRSICLVKMESRCRIRPRSNMLIPPRCPSWWCRR